MPFVPRHPLQSSAKRQRVPLGGELVMRPPFSTPPLATASRRSSRRSLGRRAGPVRLLLGRSSFNPARTEPDKEILAIMDVLH